MNNLYLFLQVNFKNSIINLDIINNKEENIIKYIDIKDNVVKPDPEQFINE